MTAFMSARIALLFAMAALPVAGQGKHQMVRPTIKGSDGLIILQNGYLQAAFDLVGHRIENLSADHTGAGRFRENLLANGGVSFEDVDSGNSLAKFTLHQLAKGKQYLRATWTTGSALHTVEMSLGPYDRGIHVVARSTESNNAVALCSRQWLMVGIFERGVVQNVAGQAARFASHSPLRLFFTSDKTLGSVALVPQQGNSPSESTLLSGGTPTESGIELRSTPSAGTYEQWSTASEQRSPVETESPGVPAKLGDLAFTLLANDLPYPALDRPDPIAGPEQSANRDSDAILTAAYSTAVAMLGSYQQPGSAYPTLAAPKRTYRDAFNFFDPDAWPVINTLSYSGDPLLQREARKILERSERDILPDGQLPHHFEGGKPVYVSIAKSTQSGPNLYWILAAVDYASATGDEHWLRQHYPTMKRAAEWILAHFDSTEGLLNVDGPLFIDVFRRSGYTLDTNAMTIRLMEAMAESAEACDDPASATRYGDFAKRLRAGLYQHLWDGHDHFVTERHPDGSTRDFIDYDGNLAAIDFGALHSAAEEQAVLHRIDKNPIAHPGGRGTWVSERRYEKADCYGNNDGDSDVTMGRIWWLDMLARVRLGDRATFDDTLAALEGDLLRDVWMNERYDSTGKPAHSLYYHEYPEFVTMVLRELRYGVRLGPREVRIAPFGPRRFTMHLGTLKVDYSQTDLSIEIPGGSQRSFLVGGLLPDTAYRLDEKKDLRSNSSGQLHFVARAGTPLHLHAMTRSFRPVRKKL